MGSKVLNFARATTLSVAFVLLALACNALVGVEDVTEKSTKRDGGTSSGDPGGDPGSDPGGPGASPGSSGDGGGITGEAIKLAVGYEHTCVVRGDGRVQCWGSNGSGELGKPTATFASSATPVVIDGLGVVTRMCAGSAFNCAIKSDGSVWCWGDNDSGELGDGTTTSSSTPVRAGTLAGATQVACGLNHACAVSSAGAFCWGNGTYGRLGNNSEVASSSPAPVSGIANVSKICAGYFHSCALLGNGTVSCWGSNDRGQLGSMTTADRSLTPLALPSLGSVDEVVLGNDSSCTRSGNRVVACFGSNTYGQLGNGTTDTGENPTPVVVDGISDPAAIAFGDKHVCAVRTGGTASCWGRGADGQLGSGSSDGGTGSASRPVTVLTLRDAIQIGAGRRHSCATTRAGEVYCWGTNDKLQLGVMGTSPRFVPEKVTGLGEL